MEFAGIKPIVFGNIYSTSRIEATGEGFDAPSEIQYTDNAGGYLVTTKRKYDLGLGAAGVWNFPYAGEEYPELVNSSFVIGLTALQNSSVIYKKSYPTLAQAKANSLSGKLPFKASELEIWNNGDSVNYMAEGGVLLSFTAVYNSIPVTLGGIFKGTYDYYIEKLEDKRVYVEITRTDLKSALLSTGIYYANASLSKVEKEGQKLSYIFDLSDEYTAKVYEDVLKGKFLEAQEMGETYPDLRVTKVETTDFKMKGKEFNIGFKTPFAQILSWNFNKSLFVGVSDTEIHSNGVITHRDYGVYKSGVSSNFGPLERTSLKAFYGATAKATVEGKDINNTSGTFVWLYESNNGTYKKLRRALSKVKDFTNLTDFLNVKIGKKKEKLNYTKLELSLEYSEAFTKYLMDTDLNYNTLKYDLVGDINTACTQRHYNYDRRIECIDNESRKARSALSSIKKYLAKMKASFKKDNKDFVSNYAKVGKKILSSKYVFQEIFERGTKCGMKLKLHMTGEKFIAFEKELNYPNTPECK
ncbi:hypothetical protein EP118_14975 [Halobacteriovorax sp. Y22]|nr:hypothetical protein EP118_14975 [Halobacteriovorax sp. Y22]